MLIFKCAEILKEKIYKILELRKIVNIEKFHYKKYARRIWK